MSSTDSPLFDWLCEHCMVVTELSHLPISRDYGSTEGSQPFVFIISVFLLTKFRVVCKD